MPSTTTYSELQLGDIVQLFDGEYGFATVKQIKDGEITFFRPYVHSEGFSYSGGVMCYIGIEEVKYPISKHHVSLYRRKALK